MNYYDEEDNDMKDNENRKAKLTRPDPILPKQPPLEYPVVKSNNHIDNDTKKNECEIMKDDGICKTSE